MNWPCSVLPSLVSLDCNFCCGCAILYAIILVGRSSENYGMIFGIPGFEESLLREGELPGKYGSLAERGSVVRALSDV